MDLIFIFESSTSDLFLSLSHTIVSSVYCAVYIYMPPAVDFKKRKLYNFNTMQLGYNTFSFSFFYSPPFTI